MGKGLKPSLRERAGAEKQKIQGMTRENALRYIWTYYKIPIIGILVFIFLVFYFIHAFLNRPEDTILHVTFVNCYDNVSEDSDFHKEFLEYADFQETGEVIFDSNVFFDLSKDSDSEDGSISGSRNYGCADLPGDEYERDGKGGKGPEP